MGSEMCIRDRVDRNDTLIAFGGGVIGDIVGFTASITLRGINFIQIPTTLLSQVDSAVGGKTGVNTKEGKNLIGTFYQPKLVISDVSLLKSLPKREILSGYAEIIKYGLIMDKRFLNWLLDNESKLMTFNKKYLIEAVFHSCKNKAIIVRKDEKEKNIRAILNLGHTFGHAIEAINNYQKSLTHGEAVSIGILMALDMSSLQGNSLNKNIEYFAGDMKEQSFGNFDYIIAMDSLIHYSTEDVISSIADFSSRANNSVLFTVIPSTFVLRTKLRLGKFFPKSERSPEVVPIEWGQLEQLEALKLNASLTKIKRIKSFFYVSEAWELANR